MNKEILIPIKKYENYPMLLQFISNEIDVDIPFL